MRGDEAAGTKDLMLPSAHTCLHAAVLVLQCLSSVGSRHIDGAAVVASKRLVGWHKYVAWPA